jgi:hypothetical protein
VGVFVLYEYDTCSGPGMAWNARPWSNPGMTTARALLLVPLLLVPLLAAAPASADDLRLVEGVGVAWLSRSGGGVRNESLGVSIELGLEGRAAPQVGWGVRLTWGLTDWDRAREYIDAGNRAGTWTTDKFAQLDRWLRESPKDQEALRLMGAFFAYVFLGATYVAVPVCYTGSIFGATSHLQLDATASTHLTDGPIDTWGEVGVGAAALPEAVHGSWSQSTVSRAVGPVLGAGVQLGKARLGGRLLWSPPMLTSSTRGATVLIGAVTLGGSL